jgi:hypothetical protein
VLTSSKFSVLIDVEPLTLLTDSDACDDSGVLKKPAAAGGCVECYLSYLETLRLIEPRFRAVVRGHAPLAWFAQAENEEPIFVRHNLL